MPAELTALALAGLLQSLQFILFAVPANLELGPGYTSSARDRPPSKALSLVTARLQRALNNHFEGLILRAYATAALSSKYEPADEESFDDDPPFGLPIKEDVKSNVEVTSNLGEPDITVNLIAPAGRKDGWTAA